MFDTEIDTSGTVINLRIPDVINAVTNVTQNPGKATPPPHSGQFLTQILTLLNNFDAILTLLVP